MRATTARLCENEMKTQSNVLELRVRIVSMINSSWVIDAIPISFNVCVLRRKSNENLNLRMKMFFLQFLSQVYGLSCCCV